MTTGRAAPLPLARSNTSAWLAECWIVDLTARGVEVYSAPSSGGYASQRTAALGEVLRAITVPELELTVTELMPAR